MSRDDVAGDWQIARLLLAVTFAGLIVFVAWRPLLAWWADDSGNRALLHGRSAEAQNWFERGLRYEPNWALLHEDRGRALLAQDPAAAFAEFERAACGAPCAAEEGDALAALGRPDAAIDRYLDAKAVGRLAFMATRLSDQGKYEAASALERDLIRRLRADFLERADLAISYATLGAIENRAVVTRAAAARYHERQAIAAFSAASNLAPYNEDYLLSYAFAQLRFGDLGAARRAFQRLLEIHPHQSDAEAALARMRVERSANRPLQRTPTSAP